VTTVTSDDLDPGETAAARRGVGLAAGLSTPHVNPLPADRAVEAD
jgi:hypothetical protein